MNQQLPPNTAHIRAEHDKCLLREVRSWCPNHDDIFALADECDRLTEKVFSYELTLDTLSKQIGELGPVMKSVFNIKILHRRIVSGCNHCDVPWPCSTMKLLGEQ